MSDGSNTGESAQGWEFSGEITIISPNGFHARPAAILVKTAKKFTSDIKLVKGDRRVNAKSLVAVMGFALEQGDSVALEASGADAAEAIKALIPIIAGDMENGAPSVAQTAKPAESAKVPAAKKETRTRNEADRSLFRGITASPGIATGIVKHITRGDIAVSERPAASPEEEAADFRRAVDEAKSELASIEKQTETAIDAGHAAIFGAHIEMLDDPELTGAALGMIATGKSAAFAWKSAYKAQAERFSGLSNELFAARAADLNDVGRRVLMILTGTQEEIAYTQNCVLVAEDLTPSDTATLDKRVLGFCTVKGGPTSHIAILARSLDLPALVGIDHAALGIKDGMAVILNADEGTLRINPDPAEVERVRGNQEEKSARRARDLEHTMEPAVTKDGVTLEVAANIGGTSDASQAASLGCDGVGLLRSEFLFLGRATAPSEDELADIYIKIAKTIGRDKPLVVRTMDIGGDKPIPYITQDAEENPFLGVRGLRLSLEHRDMFETQLRAILRASEYCGLHIMFPMVSTMEEFREASSIVRRVAGDMGVSDVKIGLMIEVPSAAILARHFAEEADFLSLGTNDLTQYTMAADRGNPKLSRIADGLNPAVLAMIKSAVDGARGKNCWVGVCGGIAGDPAAIPVLIGIGVDELSVSVPAIPQVKARVRELSKAECERIAAHVLSLGSASEARDYLGKNTGVKQLDKERQ
ncbi:MAG: phosphoenolpyruvate--protein phosphotransferase [Synergistaceae bacterium]|jgi:phosphocarrier protein FPr|nr:phosphoenolpyruvate--protein phosphotransferase [Synergistaceae bacterium]